MATYRKIGIALIFLGIIMFLLGASMFAYRGAINPIVSKIGWYSFLFWLPTIILGIVLVAITKRKRRKK
jgi:hypothetical protein